MPKLIPLIALAALAAGPVAAQDLKFTHMFAETHYMWARGGKVLMDRVTEATNGEVTFTPFPGGQLGKDYIGQLDSGIADLAIVVPATMSDKLPLTSVSELPVHYADSCEASGKLWELAKPGGPLYEAEFAKRGLHPVFTAVLPNYNVMTTSKQVKSMADMAGLKVRASGAAMERTARALGAVAVTISASEINDSLRRGTVDGAFFPYQAVFSYGLEGVLKYGLEGPILGSSSVIMVMSDKKWQSISEENRQKITGIAHEIQGEFCKWMDEEDKRVRATLIEKHGYQPHVLSEAETAEWQKQLEDVTTDWAARMDGQGLPGSAVLKAFIEAQPAGM
ncbi:TRAP transporter substrate-binding protein DctP [Ruixingdingia sedimenti]|uniref:TRAP transporter substrate-binding protein DctP n=1 Tax=Ruixingdingia sedimenti TaxID=3073604 RepID=A0ABU1FA53_9RHOB|nr:TRAP transporter substrate-binding protein DctP [Xinfangfangia sp. LG-4]MDR5653750.1 TRAP transporter substrate-binding protein DctP [Xinfangfangia sp. LG-4]